MLIREDGEGPLLAHCANVYGSLTGFTARSGSLWSKAIDHDQSDKL
jgi:hypothetical protein